MKINDFLRMVQPKLDPTKAPPADAEATFDLTHASYAGNTKTGSIFCTSCGKSPTHIGPYNGYLFQFRNAISAKEYRLSGMCQTCQDKMYGHD